MIDVTAGDRPRVVYVSYDGASEPLGRSQVIAYLVRLARGCDITLISFEKDRDGREQTAGLLGAAGIEWIACTYHRRPPVISTLWDVAVGALAVRRAVRRRRAEIVHVRSYVPALMAVLASARGCRTKLVFDIRGFWPDERLLTGAWSERNLIYRLAKRLERTFFARADAVVTLTSASVEQIRRWLGASPAPIDVIPTCADLERFGIMRRPDAGGPRVVWSGSVGSFYHFELAVRFAQALGIPFTVLTPKVEEARARLGEATADVRALAQEEVAAELRPGDIGICFYHAGFANLARSPTRFAEYLAAGMVVAVTPGIGDLEAIIEEHQLGVVIDDPSDLGICRAADRALALAADPEAHARARRVALERYSVDDGARRYFEIYQNLRAGDRWAKVTST